MTKAQIVDIKINKLETQLEQANEVRQEFEKARGDKYFEIIQKYFGGEFSLEDVYIKHNWGTSYEVLRPKEGYSYDKELMTIRIDDSWKTSEYEEIKTSMYSTSENGAWELERLITCGEVAKVILDFSDDIIAEFNTVRDEFKTSISESSSNVWKLERDIKQLTEDKYKFELERKMDLLETTGIEFSKPVNLDVRWDWTVRNINKARITAKTKSGKSASLTLETIHGEVEVENVRIDKINSILV